MYNYLMVNPKDKHLISSLLPVLLLGLISLILGCQSPSNSSKKEVKIVEAPTPKLGFVYRMCSDVAEMRKFYSDIIGLEEKTFKEEKWLVYSLNGFALQFWQWDEEIPKAEDWSWQPGNWDGKSSDQSWAFGVTQEQMQTIFLKMKEAKVPMFHGSPKWFANNKYWGLKCKDPMGYTIDLIYSPKEPNEISEWDKYVAATEAKAK